MRFRYFSPFAILAAATAADARRPEPPPTGTLTLDMAAPVITIRIGETALRLRVDLDQRDVIELNADAAERLMLRFESGSTDDVGRIRVPSRVAAASFMLNGRTVATTLSTHGTCCSGVDGAVSPALLPYGEIRFVGRPVAGGETRSFVMGRDEGYGLEVPQPVGREAVRLLFSIDRPETLATASAGAILAAASGGRLVGEAVPVPVAFGVSRPARTIALSRPIVLAGFSFAAVRSRTADFGGRRTLPQEASRSGEIVVRRRVRAQHEWPAVVIGRDRLDRCAEIRYAPATSILTLRCDFAGRGS